jgi:glyoxylase-like metal-dependent hydrolase (beta-lactamase superfamily II)
VTETYEVFALKYATRDARRGDHFLGGDPDPDKAMPMDYYVWLVRNERRAVLVDTGFKPEVGARRGRKHLRTPAYALALLGVDPATIDDVILTHLHYDHVGGVDSFHGARLHVQQRDVEFVSGPHMLNQRTRGSFEVEDVFEVMRALHSDRLTFYEGSAGIWPGLSVHLIGGHTPGMQVVRVHTRRGWVVLASDSSHYYENMESGRPFTTVYEPELVVAGFKTLEELADSHQHIVPGHDPLVMQRYPAASTGLEGIAARLDVAPRPH